MSALDTQVGGNHYRTGGIQPVEYIEANKLQFLEASVVKRMTRHDKPGGKGRQDIEKAIHELQLLLELRYPSTGLQTKTGPTVPCCVVCQQPGIHGGHPCPSLRADAVVNTAYLADKCCSGVGGTHDPGCPTWDLPGQPHS